MKVGNYEIELAVLDDKTQRELAEVTLDIVQGGSSVGFMKPFSIEDAMTFWSGVFRRAESGSVILAVAKHTESGRVIGTGQLITDLPPNQKHRADVAKMQVHSAHRKQGIGENLLTFLEERAIEEGKYVLVLDAVTDGPAYHLYKRCGWNIVGDIPQFALYPDGDLCSTTYFYKNLKAGFSTN